MKLPRIGLLPRILIAIVLAIVCGQFFAEGLTRVFTTFNGIFSQFLGFIVPLIIVGYVTPAIADVGDGVGRMLLFTVVVAYVDTVLAGLLGYGVGAMLFPDMVAGATLIDPAEATGVAPYFKLSIPPMMDVMTALITAFCVGMGIIYSGATTLKKVFDEFKEVVTKIIKGVVIPFLPLYIFGIFLELTVTGQAFSLLAVFAKVIVVIFALHLLILLYLFCIAGGLSHKNPLRLLWTMLPAYMTALGTSSSAATIPVTLEQTKKIGVRPDVAGFTVPLCATIHMPGSAMKISCCALTICLITGTPHSFGLFVQFILLLAVCAVAGPGIPGGVIMASLGPLASVLGFGAEEQALMIALYIAMDSFGTACNVTGDGAISMMVDRVFKKKESTAPEQAAA